MTESFVLACVIAALLVLAFFTLWRIRGASGSDYDLVVIGGGAAGLSAAGLAAQLGARTLLIERAKLGGDCTWTGCVPSKALLAAAETAHRARDAARFGLEPCELKVDICRVLRHVHEVRGGIYQEADSPEVVSKNGVEVRHGAARFVDSHIVELNGASKERISFRWALICVGSHPRVPDIPGLEGVQFLTNETVFELSDLPHRLLIVGGGPVSVEMAQAWQRLGSEVILIARSERLLERDDPESVEVLTGSLRQEGVTVLVGTDVTSVRQQDGEVVLNVRTSGQQRELTGSRLMIATGREANLKGLNLDELGIASAESGIRVDRNGATSLKHIYACGDAAQGPNFTHVAERTAINAASNALFGVPASPIPTTWVTFTDPELAQVGMTREQLESENTKFRCYRFPFSKLDRAAAQSAAVGHVLVWANRRGRILGASVVGERAGEIAAELSLAMQHKISLRQLADTLHAYPIFALGARRAADQWYIRNFPQRLLRVFQSLRGLRGRPPTRPPPGTVV